MGWDRHLIKLQKSVEGHNHLNKYCLRYHVTNVVCKFRNYFQKSLIEDLFYIYYVHGMPYFPSKSFEQMVGVTISFWRQENTVLKENQNSSVE